MNRKCVGCGSILQIIDKTKEGYVKENKIEEALYCERCFKIKNYGEIITSQKEVNAFEIIEKINKEKRSVLYILDTTNISNETMLPLKLLTTDVKVVLTKKDLLPKSVKDLKLISYIKERCNAEEVFITSSKKKYGIDNLLNALKKGKSKEYYVLGYTNAGKSALLNSFLNSKGLKDKLTVSLVPNTTMENVKIDIDGVTLIDSPGFKNDKSFSNFIDIALYKKLLPASEIKPIGRTLAPNFMVLINDTFRIENNTDKDIKLIFYLNANIDKMKISTRDTLKGKDKISLEISPKKDIVIEGIGFIKVLTNSKVDIYSVNCDGISLRDKLI